MKTKNLISVFMGDSVINKKMNIAGNKELKRFISLKEREIENVRSFCKIMTEEGCKIKHFDGFFVGYKIPQIGKEIDLLRFGSDFILNIEMKSELEESKKEDKILTQMRKNYYYLKSLGKTVVIFTYVEDDGFYKYNSQDDDFEKVQPNEVADCLIGQAVDYSIDPDKAFVPSKFLISPFNSTDKFIAGEYFLTNEQQERKKEIKQELIDNPFMFFCITADAGTGKTLLMYDIAKEFITVGKTVKVIHCGILNDGHKRLAEDYKWDIAPIKEISREKDKIEIKGYDIIFIDEAQRINKNQLNALIGKAIEYEISIIFSYDTKQYLHHSETLDVREYLKENHPDIVSSSKSLTNKIRTNKSMASFINNLVNSRKSFDNVDYDCVTIDYIDNLDVLKSYISFLNTEGWMPITYTTSRFNQESYDRLAQICEKNAHAVIGQEFSKVVLVMDYNFRYDESGKLYAKSSYYSAEGMLYQIVTRVVDELKIIVIDNPELYIKLLEIKEKGTLC